MYSKDVALAGRRGRIDNEGVYGGSSYVRVGRTVIDPVHVRALREWKSNQVAMSYRS